MINSESSLLNIDRNEDTGAELSVTDTVDPLKADYIPSYVGLSCAVSGYRPINRYDGASHEHCSANLTPQLSFLCGYCKAASSHLYNENNAGEQSNNGLDNIAPFRAGFCTGGPCLKPNMNLNSGNLNCSQFVRLNHSSDVGNSNSIQITSSVSCFTKEIKDDEKNRKSFVQQRIERLYGPTALGAFQTKKSLVQTLKDEERKEGNDNCSKSQQESSSPEQFPSVFRHLRPEFRHQLPVKSRTIVSQSSSLTSDISNEYPFKRNLISINKTPQETNKTWKSLSKELENVGMPPANEHISEQKPESRLASSPLREVTNGEVLQSNNRNNILQNKIEDGNYFLELIAKEVAVFESQIKKIDADLNLHEEAMSEEVRGKLLATSGKAKLFINQKLKQFQGLCYKNLNTFSEEEFPTTNEDLAGFWDMVRIQVDHIKVLFKEVDALRLNNWKESANSPSPADRPAPPKRSGPARKPQSVRTDVRKSGKGEKQESASDERRRNMRQMLSAKRKEINKTNGSNGTSGDIEIFVHAK